MEEQTNEIVLLEKNDIIVVKKGQSINLTSLIPLMTYNQAKTLEKQIRKIMNEKIMKYSVVYNDREHKCRTLEEVSELCGKSIATMHRVLKGSSQVKGLTIRII